jgi:hypothetical protein
VLSIKFKYTFTYETPEYSTFAEMKAALTKLKSKRQLETYLTTELQQELNSIFEENTVKELKVKIV